MTRAIVMTGEKHGMLLVLGPAPTPYGTSRHWRCRCDCGREHVVVGTKLRSGGTRSCGCFRVIASRIAGRKARRHGMTGTPTYSSWENMHARCTNPNNRAFKNYGGRGIRVCPRWSSFENFLDDMGVRPSRRHSIERVDVSKNYEPGNCRWATSKEQARNKRTTVLSNALVTEIRTRAANGDRQSEIASALNLKSRTVHGVVAGRRWT